MLTTAAVVVVVLSAVSGQASDQGSCGHQADTRSYDGYQVIHLRSALDTQTRHFLATSELVKLKKQPSKVFYIW